MNRLEPETTAAFGLIAWLEETKITLPLKGVECRFDVTGEVAAVEIDQIYYQSHAQPLDCTYTFPLPSGAAVYRCEMHVNGRVIRAKVEAQEDARRIFAKLTAAGHRAAMVEVERDNLFTLSLGNLQPQDVVVIRFAYFQTVERIGASQRLRIPVCPGVRYVPGRPLLRALSGRGTSDDTDQVPDASRISPPRIDALHPDAAYFAAQGTVVRSEVAAGTLSSSTHRLRVHEAAEVYAVELAQSGAVPDRDLVVTWSEPREAKLAPRAWTFADGGETYALVQLRAPAQVSVAEAFEQDVYFLVDRSGSMEGLKWTKTCAALTGFVKLLGARDRVWITLFESSFQDFAEAPLPAPQILRDPGFIALARQGVGGGTEVFPAAAHLLAKIDEHSSARPATLVFLTDGQVGNERQLLDCFRPHPGLTVHVFGIDTAVNDAFLKRLARQQGGECWLQTPDDDIAGTVATLADRLRRPVLTQIAAGPGWECSQTRLPDLRAGQVIDLAVRRTTSAPLEVTGLLVGGERYRFPLTPVATPNPALKLLWARERIELHLASGQSREAIELAKRHNLLCEGAAFIAWDEEEKVMVSRRQIFQPALQPELVCGARESVGLFEMPMRVSRDSSSRRSLAAPPSADRGLGEAFDPGHLPQAGDFLIVLIEAGVDEDLAHALDLWSVADPQKHLARHRALMRLVFSLESFRMDPAGRIERCRQFILRELDEEPELSIQLLDLAIAWEQRVQV